MGTGASGCPAEKTLERERQRAMKRKYSQSKPTELYIACQKGDIDSVKEHLSKNSVEDIDKLEPNGDTALHLATRNDDKGIVQLLLNAGCSRTKLNYRGKRPYEESRTPEMEKMYQRPMSESRFVDTDHKKSVQVLRRRAQDDEQQPTFEWIKPFDSEEELHSYHLNHQTAAMWFKFFNWASHRFSGVLNRADFRADLFDLERDRDFLDFLKNAINDDTAYGEAIEHLKNAETDKQLDPLIKLYTSEIGSDKNKFYQLLNRQLARASENDMNTAHCCDRFVYEFEMKSDQLEKWIFTGQTFRGVSMTDLDIKVYEDLANDEEKGAMLIKTFTSTSKNEAVAMRFLEKTPKEDKRVLFVYNISKPCRTIVDVESISEYADEEEVLIIPGNLFRITKVVNDSKLIKIYLDHVDINVSFFEKLRHTWKAARRRPNVD